MEPAPQARIAGLISLGRGVAYRIESSALEDMRNDIACSFAGLLTPQDAAAWRPHVTIQNKVAPQEARALLHRLERDFSPRPISISGLAAWFYRDGDWDPIAAYGFGGGRRLALGNPAKL